MVTQHQKWDAKGPSPMRGTTVNAMVPAHFRKTGNVHFRFLLFKKENLRRAAGAPVKVLWGEMRSETPPSPHMPFQTQMKHESPYPTQLPQKVDGVRPFMAHSCTLFPHTANKEPRCNQQLNSHFKMSATRAPMALSISASLPPAHQAPSIS